MFRVYKIEKYLIKHFHKIAKKMNWRFKQKFKLNQVIK